MSTEERCERFLKTLNPIRPDPPKKDKPYEYPFTVPCAYRSWPWPWEPQWAENWEEQWEQSWEEELAMMH
jgi:hypothetical protein